MEENNLNIENKDALTKKQAAKYCIIKKLAIVLVAIIATAFLFNSLTNTATSSHTAVTSALHDQKVISELSTLIVPCGGIYEEKDNNGKDILAIAYSGTVEYGLDFSQINILLDEENKKITVKIPSINIKEVYIDPSSISLIPEGKFNETTLYLQKCKNDLLNSFTNNSDEMYTLAKATAIETLSSFLGPIVESINDGYHLVVEMSDGGLL